MKYAYIQAMETFVEAHAFKNHLKALLIKAVTSLYINDFDNAEMGYAQAAPEQLPTHLVESNGRITARELEKNLARIATPWNSDTPIETVFANGTNCRKFAVGGNDPISDAVYVRVLVKISINSGVLERAVSDWERKPDAKQTVLPTSGKKTANA
jgi:hypothetical protein